MAVYESYNQLKNRVLVNEDEVHIKVRGITHTYRVYTDFIYPTGLTHSVRHMFAMLNIPDRHKFCSGIYGYSSGDGEWPESSGGDYAALTRAVLALYGYIEILKRTNALLIV